tara:strand:+ start:545 stop:814 length:270 start_codon:yes stop_codon:yes gene_type:complete
MSPHDQITLEKQAMNLGISKRLQPLLAEVKEFMETEIVPLERAFHDEIAKEDRALHTVRKSEILKSLSSRFRSRTTILQSETVTSRSII